MSRRRLTPLTATLALAAVAVSGATGVAVADRDDRDDRPRSGDDRSERQRPNTDQASAVLTGERRKSVRQTVCQGEDGEYREALEVFEGTATSGDPRLAGDLKVTIRSLINRSPNQQEGTVDGRIEIRGAGSNRPRTTARFSAVSDDAATLEGTLVGRVKQAGGDDPGRGDERLFANFFGSFNAMDDEQDFRVALGQAPPTDSPQSSAVIQRSECPAGPGAPRARG